MRQNLREIEMKNITNIQKFSIHDGDGIRTTVFFKGCPLKCEWCHNPETQRFEKEMQVDREKCTGCGTCASVCPNGAVRSPGDRGPGIYGERINERAYEGSDVL